MIQYSIEKYCDALEAVYTYYFLINCIINGRCEECFQKIKGIKSKSLSSNTFPILLSGGFSPKANLGST